MTNIIPFKKQKIQNRKCSFCGTLESAAKQFIASNTSNHCICGKCVVEGKKRLEEESK